MQSQQAQTMDEQQALAAPYSIEWQGRTLKLSLIGQDVKAAFTADCKAHAAREHREYMAVEYPEPLSDDDRQRIAADQAAYRLEMTTGQYSWGGSLSEAWRRTPTGSKALLKHLLADAGNPLNDAELSSFRAEKAAELDSLIQIIMWDSEAPKAKRPTTPTAATPATTAA